MTTEERHIMRQLIPDLLPPHHVSVSTKRVNFIYGQGAILFDDIFAVEVYIPRDPKESCMFFATSRHHGDMRSIGPYGRKLRILRYDHPTVSKEARAQFEEAIFQAMPPVTHAIAA